MNLSTIRQICRSFNTVVQSNLDRSNRDFILFQLVAVLTTKRGKNEEMLRVMLLQRFDCTNPFETNFTSNFNCVMDYLANKTDHTLETCGSIIMNFYDISSENKTTVRLFRRDPRSDA